VLTIGSGTSPGEFVFDLRSLEELKTPVRRFHLTGTQIRQVNLNTGTAPIFRTKFDADLTATIYDRVPILIDDNREQNSVERKLLADVRYGQ
jgi:hypothetical protein